MGTNIIELTPDDFVEEVGFQNDPDRDYGINVYIKLDHSMSMYVTTYMTRVPGNRYSFRHTLSSRFPNAMWFTSCFQRWSIGVLS